MTTIGVLFGLISRPSPKRRRYSSANSAANVSGQRFAGVLRGLPSSPAARRFAVNLAIASLSDSGFAACVRAQLLQAPRAARLVWLEVPEAAAADQFELVRELARQLRPTGARVGLEHAGERIGRIERLFELGLDYVKLDASITRDIARDAARAGFVNGVVAMLHSLSVQVIAEGVAEEADATALWQCGVDAQTGPFVSAQRG